MGFSSRDGESRRNRDEVGVRFGKPREKPREAKVVTDREPELADRSAVHQDGALPCSVHARFAPALPRWQVDVEQMHLVIGRTYFAGTVDDEAAIGDLAVLGKDRKRSDVKPDPVTRRSLAAGGKH